MPSPRKNGEHLAPVPDLRRRLLGVLIGGLIGVLPFALPSASRAEGEFDLAKLMQLLAGAKPGHATFTERRQVAMLDKPLESSGILSFEPPDTFVRETLKPRPERVAVSGNTLTMTRGGLSRSVAIDAAPEAGVIVEAIRGTLSGNREALDRHFTSSVSGTPQRWLLELIPRESRLREQVSLLQMRGREALVHEVQVQMANGDRSVMTIMPAEAPASGASH